MNLRVCDGGGERILPASIEVVEQTLAPAVVIREGTEISLADNERSLVALAVETDEFLLSSFSAENATLTGPVSRQEAVRRFREFLLGQKAQENRGGSSFR